MEKPEENQQHSGSGLESSACYALMPGEVKSKNDGDIHYIGCKELMRLYCLEPRQCFDGSNPDNWPGRAAEKITKVYPRYDGDYPIFRHNGGGAAALKSDETEEKR